MTTTNDSPGAAGADGPLARAKSLSQFTAFFIAGIYGAGFVVVTFYEARFGIVEFSVLRPRIISAGVAFAFFLVIPLVVAFWT